MSYSYFTISQSQWRVINCLRPNILSAANEKVNAGTLKTDDAAYTAEFDKAKNEFAAAVVVLEKAAATAPSIANATKLLEACKAVK